MEAWLGKLQREAGTLRAVCVMTFTKISMTSCKVARRSLTPSFGNLAVKDKNPSRPEKYLKKSPEEWNLNL